MPFITEKGTIVEVIRGPRPVYKVRTHGGRIVIVGGDQLMPPRMTILPVGETLLVTYNDQGKVTSASWKNSVAGQVVRIEGYSAKTVYHVQLEDGNSVPVSREVVDPHPERTLAMGAELDVTLENGQVRRARLIAERLQVSVQRVDRSAGTVSVRGPLGDDYTVRLGMDALRQIQVGERLAMQIQYGEKGERRMLLERAVKQSPKPSAPAQTTRPARVTPTGLDRTPLRTDRPAPPKVDTSAPQVLGEAEIAGIDPLYLAERKRENHRVEVMSFLDEHSRDGLVEWYRMRDAHPARFGKPQKPLLPVMQQVLQAAEPNLKGFYLHQALALDAIRAGKHLVIVTQTASGKTLSYNPAIFETMCQEPGAHALYVFPLNALMTDQKEKVDTLVRELGSKGVRVTAERLQGGMGGERQEMARRSPNIVTTNPEMLSVILNEPDRWSDFFRTLRYVVIDEVHSYRGIFGVHMSGLVRRLLLTARRFGAQPQLILCSATVSNPLDLAVRLTALPQESFALIAENEDGSRQDYKHWAVLNPDWGISRSRYDNYLDVAARVFIELISGRRERGRPVGPLNTILFARSIRDVNRLKRLVMDNLRERNPGLMDRVRAYVSAELTVSEKREIYDGLRSGKMVGVISTNALEAGIDIGKLDACIIAGFPFSVMRMRQMAGRVGRQQEGLVLYAPYPLSGLDGYYRDHPDLLLTQPPEVFVVDPENPYVARKHINAAAVSLGGLTTEMLRGMWGMRGESIVKQAIEDGAMKRGSGRYYGTRRDFANPEDVYAVHSIRSNTQKPYAVCPDDGQVCQMRSECYNQQRRGCAKQINVIDQMYAYRDCHPGAVYEVNGRLYQVTQFDDANRVVRVKDLPDDHPERTFVEEEIQVEVGGEPRGRKRLALGIELAWGDVVVTRLFTGYRVNTLIPGRTCRRCRKEYGEGVLSCPSCGRPTETNYIYSKAEQYEFPGQYRQGFQMTLKTVACWLAVDPELERELGPASPCKLPGDKNQVQAWLKAGLNLKQDGLNSEEKKLVSAYHEQAGEELRNLRPTNHESVLFPGVYGQCLLHTLRDKLGESRSLELYQHMTGYPVTTELRHVCRKCQTSTLMEALHTLEHTVVLRYPSVALGDLNDLGAFSTLGHAGVGRPAVFWFDDYEGGLGAAEKIFEKFTEIVEAGAQAVQDCPCTVMEGCPRCTHVGGCVNGNDSLSKAALLALANRITGKQYTLGSRPFVYRRKRAADFSQAYQRNEYAKTEHGIGEEAPTGGQNGWQSAYQILRVQREVHESVARKAFEVRSKEIAQEVPPVSAMNLMDAYRQVMTGRLQQDWKLDRSLAPYRVLEVLPTASTKMIQQIYRVIALQVHPDAHPEKQNWANEMMKIVNAAYDAVMAEKRE